MLDDSLKGNSYNKPQKISYQPGIARIFLEGKPKYGQMFISHCIEHGFDYVVNEASTLPVVHENNLKDKSNNQLLT